MKNFFFLLFLLAVANQKGRAQCSNDITPPNVTLRQNAFANFYSGLNGNGLSAKDFVESLSDNCTDSSQITLKVRRINQSPTEFADWVHVNCFDVYPDTVVVFEIKATDVANNPVIVQRVVTVYESPGVCHPRTAHISFARTEQNQSINNVAFELNGKSSNPSLQPDLKRFLISDTSGRAYFNIGQPFMQLIIAASRQDQPLEGVSTIDLLNISKHILGTQKLDSPYKILAADVNNSRSVTTFDVLTLRKLILGVIDTLPDGQSWRFVDKRLHFNNPQNPFGQSFNFAIDTILGYTTYNATYSTFVGYKIGDVNGSANPQNTPKPALEDRANQPLWMENAHLQAGETATIPVFAGSSDWQGFQFALQFDPNQILIEKVLPSEWKGFGEEAYALPKAGLLTVSWFDAEGRPAPSDEPLFYLKIKALANITLSETLHFSTEKIGAEAYGQNERSVNLGLEFIEKPHPSLQKMEVSAIVPNPTTAGATVPVWLKEDANITLKVMDMAGNVVKSEALLLTAGRHRLSINASDLPHSGVWTVQIGCKNTVEMQRLVRL